MQRSDLFEVSSINGIEKLTLNEFVEYNGGESLWRWITYGVGQGVRGVKYVFQKNVDMIVEQGGYNVSTAPFK